MNFCDIGVVLYPANELGAGSWISKVRERFRTQKVVAKSQTLNMLTALFYLRILNMNRVSIQYKTFQACSQRTLSLKRMAIRAPKAWVSEAFENRAPSYLVSA